MAENLRFGGSVWGPLNHPKNDLGRLFTSGGSPPGQNHCLQSTGQKNGGQKNDLGQLFTSGRVGPGSAWPLNPEP